MSSIELSQNALNFFNELMKTGDNESLTIIKIIWNVRQMNKYNKIYTILEEKNFDDTK